MARKKKEEESAGAPWLATFADLMNLLLCFFVLLFAYSSPDSEKLERIAASFSGGNFSIFSGEGSLIGNGMLVSTGIKQLENLEEYKDTEFSIKENNGASPDFINQYLSELENKTSELYDELSDMIEKNNIEEQVNISMDPNFQYVRFSLNGSILFDSGKADLKSDAMPLLSKLGDILRVYKGYHIEIEGHTDNRPISNGTYLSNDYLSSARAINAATYLIREKGMDPKTLSWTGRGEYDPVASNDTEEGRQKNRRVEVKIYSNILD